MTRKTNEQGQFYCRGCNEWKAPTIFPRRASSCGRVSRCKRCRANYLANYRARKRRDSHIQALIQHKAHQFF
ncbi:hypothetical protein [uncultured Microbulbifer sp.]|uniref:hypothetical protein n=1 Tax=uncultured Microbulbifer sp. TaxID=348147 RepID=UPI002639843D|nr:hypothetical protein [uncultured Microbulbifer sp.]